jgi:hypothetical protein
MAKFAQVNSPIGREKRQMPRYIVQVDSDELFEEMRDRAEKTHLTMESFSTRLRAIALANTTRRALLRLFGDLHPIIERNTRLRPDGQ